MSFFLPILIFMKKKFSDQLDMHIKQPGFLGDKWRVCLAFTTKRSATG
jgi:hypothetical protein